jgi:hypothetical protein
VTHRPRVNMRWGLAGQIMAESEFIDRTDFLNRPADGPRAC